MRKSFLIALYPVLIFMVPWVSAQDSLMVHDSSSLILTDSSLRVLNILVQPEASNVDSLSVNENEDDEGKPPELSELISFGKIFWTIVVLIIGYISTQILIKILELFSEKWTKYRITIKGISPIMRVFGWSLIIYIIVAGIIKPPQTTVIAFTASVGVAIAFASQDILKNLFAGIVIIFDRPFSVGDKIEVGEYYGEVREIGLRSTRIVTPDDSVVALPNAEVMNNAVSNANSGEPNCQVVAEIYLPIDADTSKIRQVAIESAQVSQYIYLDKPIVVLFFNEVKERRSYLKMRLKAYVMDIRYEFDFKSDMTEIVIRELISAGLISPDELF